MFGVVHALLCSNRRQKNAAATLPFPSAACPRDERCLWEHALSRSRQSRPSSATPLPLPPPAFCSRCLVSLTFELSIFFLLSFAASLCESTLSTRRLLTDVKDIGYVINYDMPSGIEDYIHRIGRTARAGAKGTAISYVTPDAGKIARDLVKILKDAKQVVPPQLEEIGMYGGGGGGGYRGGGGRGGGGRGGGYGGGGRW